MQPIDRASLSDAVAQFLAQGGQVEQVKEERKVEKPKSGRRQRPRASGVAITNPYDVPLSLQERQFEPQVRECARRGLTLVQSVAAVGIGRHSILRLCKEFDLELRGTQPKTPAQFAQALREAYHRGVPHSVACNRLHLTPELGARHYRDCKHLLDDAPQPPALHEGSEASILSEILLGLDSGLSLAEVVKEKQLDASQAYRIYTKHKRVARRLL